MRRVLGVAVVLAALWSSARADATVWPSSHQRVADALAAGDVTERRGAAAKLLTLPPKLAKGLALKALRDEDIEVRIFAAQAAASFGVDRAGDEVVEWLQDRDARLRVAACELIEAAPTPASVQALARVLGDAQASVRQAAAAAMGSSGMADAVSPLLGHLDDGARAVRLEVVRALGRIGDLRAVVPLVSKLQDQEDDVRREAARALGQLGDVRATATLVLALGDKSLGVRVQALEALGRLRADDATAAIAALLGGDDELVLEDKPVRDAAIAALGRIGSEQAVVLLVATLDQEGPVPLDGSRPAPVRDALVLAGARAVEPLVKVLNGAPTQAFASAAALALARLGAGSALEDVSRAARRGTVALDAGLLALGELSDARALPFVLEHLDDEDARVRQIAVTVATRLLDPGERDGRAVDVVQARVMDMTTSLSERVALVKLLGKTGSPRAQALLLTLSRNKTTALRVAVVEALGTLDETSPAIDDALLDALADPSERLRVAAATAMGRVGREAAARKLLHRLGVSAEQDRAAVAVALSGTLGRSKDAALARDVASALDAAPVTVRDALIEGLGRMQSDEAARILTGLSGAPDPDDRRKVAEALGAHANAEAALIALARDGDPTVRANAVWSLGKVGGSAALALLTSALDDLDVAVAGNAAASLARVAARLKQGARARVPLCAASSDYRPYVRAAALTGLARVGLGCDGGAVRHLLRKDRAWRVRLAAADLLRVRAPGRADGHAEASLDTRALWRCAVEDRDATVARRCDVAPPESVGTDDVLVYVVPDGKTTPTARAPFALVLADGTMRLGVVDRRGALFEKGAPGGKITLAVPAALVR